MKAISLFFILTLACSVEKGGAIRSTAVEATERELDTPHTPRSDKNCRIMCVNGDMTFDDNTKKCICHQGIKTKITIYDCIAECDTKIYMKLSEDEQENYEWDSAGVIYNDQLGTCTCTGPK